MAIYSHLHYSYNSWADWADRNMTMCYRGDGVGHKALRDANARFEPYEYRIDEEEGTHLPN